MCPAAERFDRLPEWVAAPSVDSAWMHAVVVIALGRSAGPSAAAPVDRVVEKAPAVAAAAVACCGSTLGTEIVPVHWFPRELQASAPAPHC